MRKALIATIIAALNVTPSPVMGQSSPPTTAQVKTPTTSPKGAPSVKEAFVDPGYLIEAHDEQGYGVAPRTTGLPQAVPVPTWSFWIYNYIDGVFCRQRVTTRSAARAEGLKSYATQADLPDCATPPRAQPRPGPDDAARKFWEVRILPKPALEVVPGYALTGKPVYLQIHGDPARAFDVDNPLGDDVTISASSTYEIDWGDHSPTTRTSSQGGPWPNGDVTHTYVNVTPGTTITVTQRWSATWRAGASGGQLDGLQTTGTLTFPVTQLQAVRNT